MGLEEKVDYFDWSIKHPEPVLDNNYYSDELIIDEEENMKKIDLFRKLIEEYCESKLNEKLDEIKKFLRETAYIQYTEFLAFWKTRDVSLSSYRSWDDKLQKEFLKEILEEYCKERYEHYKGKNYSRITIQALYDSASSRTKGKMGIEKIKKIMKKILEGIEESCDIESFEKKSVTYFLPDENRELFESLKEKYQLSYEFGEKHGGKIPDVVLKVNNKTLLIEAKHINESGGAQDKQIVELKDFIKQKEGENIHYVAFLDGRYWECFSEKDISEIKEILEKHPNNFFVNTEGFKKLLEDIKEHK